MTPTESRALRMRAAIACLDTKVAELRAQLALVTPDVYAAMQDYERRFVDSARRAVAAYDRQDDGAAK
jgi:hypothetical protein